MKGQCSDCQWREKAVHPHYAEWCKAPHNTAAGRPVLLHDFPIECMTYQKKGSADMPLNWDTTPNEAKLIDLIVDRAEEICAIISRGDLTKDITAAHLNGCPLDLADLVNAPQQDFAHDVFGIQASIDRTTGTLKDCFVPRHARRESP